MKMLKGLYAAAGIAAAAIAMPAIAATPIVSGGKLAGATGVQIGGNSYDVAFVDGSCASVFGGCTTSNFAFTTLSSATNASNALLAQVFGNGPAGAFDSRPNLIAGCGSSLVCNILTPYAQGHGIVLAGDAINTFTTSLDFSAPAAIGANTSTATLGGYVYARFTPSVTTAVPEPGTWAMMFAGFGLMGVALRYRRRSTRFSAV